MEKLTGSRVVLLQFGISSNKLAAAFGVSGPLPLRMLPDKTMFLRTPIALMMFVLPEALGP